jgi:hypothetical protein
MEWTFPDPEFWKKLWVWGAPANQLCLPIFPVANLKAGQKTPPYKQSHITPDESAGVSS